VKAQKIVFIIPGYRHNTSQKGYLKLVKILKTENFYSIKVNIPWRQSTIIQNMEFFLKTYKKNLKKIGKKEVYLLGFSYGALIAFLAATEIKVSGLILCSLSPFFKEDLTKIKIRNLSILEKKRFENFSKLKSIILAKKIKAKKVMMIYGEKESKPLIARVKKIFKQINLSVKYLFTIQNVAHNISDTKYISAIHLVAKSFL